MATKVKPSRLQVSGTPQVGQVPVYVDEDTFAWGAGGGGGGGDVMGPASSTDGDIVLFDGATGKVIKDSGKTVSGLESSISANTTAIGTINGKIPSAATSSNQLADKAYVNDSINSVTAYYITKNAQGDQWASYAELAAATTFYSGGAVRVPTRNDYTVVLDDETHSNATTRYSYQGNGWEYQYTVHETALTQAQLDALNSGITAAKVSTYDGYVYDIADKQDELVSGVNIRTINGTSILGSGDIVTPTGPTYSAGTGINIASDTISNTGVTSFNGGTGAVTYTAPVTSVNGQTGAVTVEEGDSKVFTISDLTSAASLATATQAYTYAYTTGKNAIIRYSGYNYVYTLGGGSAAMFTSSRGNGAVSSSNWTTIRILRLTVSSGNVTAISNLQNYINISSSAPSSSTTNNTITLVI